MGSHSIRNLVVCFILVSAGSGLAWGQEPSLGAAAPFELTGEPGQMRLAKGDEGPSSAAVSACLYSEEAKLLASDGARQDLFGISVAASGDVVVVGARLDDDNGFDSGSAYVYRWDGASWVEEAQLLASDGGGSDWFGHSVAAAGDVVVVGSRFDDDNGGNSGSAYVYRWDGASWVEEQKLLASDGAAFDEFAFSVAGSGDMVVVGAWFDDDNGSGSGSAYVYRWDGANWVEEAKLLASDGAVQDEFGVSVAATGDVVVVGAYLDDDNGNNSGSAYVYRWNGASWVEEQKLLASDGASNDRFGTHVAAAGDVVVVGAFWDDDNGSNSGSAYVYRWDGASWVEEEKLLASDGASDDRFGLSVGASGDVVVVGSMLDDDNGGNSGSAYVYRWDGASWVEEEKLLASDGAEFDIFGYSVGVTGDVVVVGAVGDDDNGADSGSAYVYRCLENTPPVCDAGDDYTVECSANMGTVALDGTGSSDPDGDPLDFRWSNVDCPGGLFSDETAADPSLELQGPPPCPVACEVSLEVSDGQASTSCSAAVTVQDTLDPEPVAGSLEACYPSEAAAEAAGLSETGWNDVCDADIDETATVAGTCSATVTVRGSDDCGNGDSVDYATRVDGEAPTVTAPAPGQIECKNPQGLALSDPDVQAWLAQADYSDNCGLAESGHDAPALFPNAPCVGDPGTEVTFAATDECGLSASASSSLAVVDTTPPQILEIGYDGMCVWSPNHKYLEIADVASMVVATDLCASDLSYQVTGCVSNQADDALGSGNTDRDCEITPDGRGVVLRAERMGPEGAGNEGREYEVSVRVSDECDNSVEGNGTIFVPHDNREHPECVRAGRLGSLP